MGCGGDASPCARGVGGGRARCPPAPQAVPPPPVAAAAVAVAWALRQGEAADSSAPSSPDSWAQQGRRRWTSSRAVVLAPEAVQATAPQPQEQECEVHWSSCCGPRDGDGAGRSCRRPSLEPSALPAAVKQTRNDYRCGCRGGAGVAGRRCARGGGGGGDGGVAR